MTIMNNTLIYYYNEVVIKQFYNKSITEIETIKKVGFEAGFKGMLSGLVSSIQSRLSGEIEHVENIKETIPEIVNVEKTIASIWGESDGLECFPKEDNCIYKYSGDISISRVYDKQLGKMLVQVCFTYQDYCFTGFTSSEKWVSASSLNLMLLQKHINTKILFTRQIRANEKKQPVQIIAITAWENEEK